MISARLQNLQKTNQNTDINTLLKKAGKEVVIRFGLNTGIGAALGKSFSQDVKSISDDAFPEYNDISFDLNNPSNPLASKFISISGGFSHLANRFKKGNTTTSEDVDSIINAFAADFEDGVFDGKTATGTSITLGSGSNQITFSSTPLTTILYPAILAYFVEGGTLSVGTTLPNGVRPTTISTAQLSSIQFIDNTPIITSDQGFVPEISFSNTGFSFPMNRIIAPITPSITSNSPTSCTSTPTLPTGLSINPSTCTISGTPTTWQATTNYVLKASNSFGSTTSNINISITSDGSIWTGRTLPSTAQWVSITYGNGVFLAIGGNGIFNTVAFVSGTIAATSP